MKYHIRHGNGFQKWQPFLAYPHGQKFAPTLLTSNQALLFPIQTPECSSAIWRQNLEYACYQAFIFIFSKQALKGGSSVEYWFPHKSDWLSFKILPRVCWGTQGAKGLCGKIWDCVFVLFCQYILMRHHGGLSWTK